MIAAANGVQHNDQFGRDVIRINDEAIKIAPFLFRACEMG